MKFVCTLLVVCLFALEAMAQGGSKGTQYQRIIQGAQAPVLVKSGGSWGSSSAIRYVQAKAYVVQRLAPPVPRVLAWKPVKVYGSAGGASTKTTTTTTTTTTVSTEVQQHTEAMAARGRLFHFRGRSFAKGARFEGVGFSTRSRQAALEACCYYGDRDKTLVESHVVRGPRGWYATARFR